MSAVTSPFPDSKEAYELGDANKTSFLRSKATVGGLETAPSEVAPWYVFVGVFTVFYGILAAIFSGLLSAALDYGGATLWTFFVLFIFFLAALGWVIFLGRLELSREDKEMEGVEES